MILMKKICLLAVLCLAPLFVSHAADLTISDCEKIVAFHTAKLENKTIVYPERNEVSYLTYEFFNIFKFHAAWLSKEDQYSKSLYAGYHNGRKACEKAIINEKDSLKKEKYLLEARLNLQLLTDNYKKLEQKARMPFVHHGNVLPGPQETENGSDYLEQKFLPKFINAILIFLMSLSILMIIVGGLMFIFSSGDQEMTTRGKTTIMWAIVGVVLTILSYAIVQFIIGIDFTL